MAISLKLLLYKGKQYVDGSRPVMLQYIINGKAKRKVICRCLEEDWDEKKGRVKPKTKNAIALNKMISTAHAEAESQLFEVQFGNKTVKSLLAPPTPTSFNGAIEQELARLKEDMKPKSYHKLIAYCNQIKGYCDPDILDLKDMDLDWFRGYAHFLTKSGNIPITAQKKVKTIRAVVINYLGKDRVPEELRNFRIPVPKTIKQKLTPAEFDRIQSLELPSGDVLCAVRDLFVMQVYLRGIRIGDLLQARCDQFHEGYFRYTDDKTSKLFAIKLLPAAQRIVDVYLSDNEYLFPFFKWKYNPKLTDFDNKVMRLKKKEGSTALVNKYLKMIATMADISKPLSSHIARHTFARMAIDKINNPMVTMELLGHSSLAVHQRYLNDLRKDEELDRAADEIFK
jgi:integrase/recombinase XerD